MFYSDKPVIVTVGFWVLSIDAINVMHMVRKKMPEKLRVLCLLKKLPKRSDEKVNSRSLFLPNTLTAAVEYTSNP